MEKRNIKPQQTKPVIRPTVPKQVIEELSEEQLTAGWSNTSGEIVAAYTDRIGDWIVF